MKKNNKGFSLVELMIALAISGIVMTALVLLVVQSLMVMANRQPWHRFRVMLM